MAIGTTPLFSKITGSAGPVDFRTRRNGKIEIGKKRIPYQPHRSAAQQEINEKYGSVVEIWRISSTADLAAWNESGNQKNISGFNFLVYLVISPALYNEALYDISSYGA